jgi:pimeloyl-ACP methyl ester carboxylesterase
MKKHIALACAGCLLALAAAWYLLPASVLPTLLALNRAASGLSEHSVAAAGHDIRYLSGGEGEPIVMLHGLFAEKDHWVEFARPLTGKYRVIAPDLPGFGASGRRDDARYNYDAQVDRLVEFLDALGLQRVHLAGNSMGGTLAVLFALKHPQRVASVALVGSPHGIRSPSPSAMDRLIDAGHAPLVVGNAEEFDQMMDLVFSARPFLPYPVLHASRADAIARSGSNVRLWRDQLADRYLLDARIGELAAPLLVLWGDADRVFDVSGARVIAARLPHARVDVLPSLGHLPMMEAPRATAQAYRSFLQGEAASRGLQPANGV